ncbi:hypothetical protein [Bradyrhizobium valentinum]|uniref:Uncharacterized protein n=1 Tax=Bradyrhizobium valentinum TaxID=1518501 RepID=A0A0R3LJT8_9BRAD|nr:hypothetical protein [Bradyrhizobium valentinum]KRR00960.1 hypothetical protein CQ10_21645 [Bradyrhizobium valentinum]KRR05446.1 hypothetical protein CP49_02850 [Bradyrhizobium valentinum]
MVKILMGLAAAVVIAVGGFFGFEFYTQHRIEGEVATAFEQIRATGGKASHGKVSFDLRSRTLKIADIATESASQPPVSVKIASITASGVGQPDAARFSADAIEAIDLELNARMAAGADWQVTYKVPRIAAKDFSGPASLPRPPASSSMIDQYRFLIEQLGALTASSITVPSVAGAMNSGNPALGSGEFAYSNVTLRDIKAGKIAAVTADRMTFTGTTQAKGKAEKVTGDLANLAAQDVDAVAAATILDPQRANDDQYYRVYRQITAGPYTIISGQGPKVRIDGLTVDDIGARPSRLQLAALLATIPSGTAQLTPAQSREMIEKMAKIYEGVRIGNAEMRDFSMDMPEGGFKLASMRFSLENGKTGEFAIEGFDGRTPQGPVKLSRFALKSLDIAGLLRMTALFSNPAQPPPPDQTLGMIALLEGAELKGFTAPYKNTGRPINVDLVNLDWGQFVGPIPSKARLIAKMSSPLDTTHPGQRMLIAAGLDKMAIDLDLGTAWTEASRSFVLEPATVELGGMLKASARVSLGNVPREVFSINPIQAAAVATQIEAGEIEFTVRDLGGVDLAVAHYARMQNISRDAARQAIVQDIRASAAKTATSNPDAEAIVDALARFIETPRTTLTIKLTPLGKVQAMQLFQMLQTDPLIALAQFRIEASTGL